MSRLPLNQILYGDCVEVLQGFPKNSVDLVVTDPPYGLGFMGKEWDKALPPKEAFEQMIRILKPGALAFVMSSPRQDLMARMILLLEDAGFKTDISFIDWIYKTGFPKAYDVSKGIDKKLGIERKEFAIDHDFLRRNPVTNHKDDYHGNLKDGIIGAKRTIPESYLAKEWDGWKSVSGLKPAHEPVLMVYKPRSEKTIVDNVLRWGTGAMNVDACRIPLKGEDISDYRNRGYLDPSKENWRFKRTQRDNIKGRFPANLLVSDKAIDTGEMTKSGLLEPHHKKGDENGNLKNYGIYGKFKAAPSPPTYGDIGDQSRYFDLDAWAEHHGFLDVAKPSKAERDFGLDHFTLKHAPIGNYEGRDLENPKNIMRPGMQDRMARNTHPTVKPVKLMAYLIELGCPPGGVVLDPFVGSGTTCIAAKQLARRYIGVEIDEEYCRIAEARIAAYPQPLEWFEDIHLSDSETE